MSDDLDVLEKGAGLIGLDDDLALIKALVEIGKKQAELADKIDGAASAQALLKSVVEGIDDENVIAALDKLGLADARTTLKGLLEKIQGLKEKIPEKYWKLLEPMSKYDEGGGEIEWSLIDASKDVDVGDEFTLGFGGSASIDLEAGDRPTIAGVEIARPLMRLGLEADVHAKASGSVPIKFGSVSGEAEGSLAIDFEYYFDCGRTDSLYALEVARRLPVLPNPFDFDGVWEAFHGELALDAMVFTFKEKAKAGVKVAVADSGSFADILVDVKASIEAEASLERTFQLTLSSADTGIAVLLTRGAQRKAGIKAGLTVGVDFSIPAARVHAILKKAVDKWDKSLGEITPYLSPGTLLQTKLKGALDTDGLIDRAAASLIKDDDLRAALERDLSTALGIDSSDESQLKSWLSTKIEKSIDKGAAKILDQVNEVRDEALAELENLLPTVREDVTGALRAKLTDAIDPLIGQAKTALLDKVREMIDESGGDFTDALKKAGVWSGNRIDDLDEALAPLRDLIERFNKILHDALDIAGDASKQKISASLQLEEQWLWGETDQIAGTFIAHGDGAKQLFRQMTRGDLEELVKIVHHTVDVPADFDLDEERSFVKKTAQRTSGGNFALTLFGVGSVDSWMFSGEATLLVDGNGNVRLDSKGEADKRAKLKREERQVSFVDTQSLQLVKTADGLDVEASSISVTIGIVDQDESMKLEELQNFIRSVEEVGMIGSGTADRAAPLFAQWAGPDGTVPAGIAAKLRLDKAMMERLMRLDRRDKKGRLDKDVAIEIIAIATKAAKEADVSSMDQLEDGLRSLAGRLDDVEFSGTPDAFMYYIVDKRVRVRDKYSGMVLPTEVNVVIAQQARIEGLLEMIEILGQIYRASPKSAANPNGWDEREYSEAQKDVAAGAGRWLATNRRIGEIKSDVHPVTAAFLRIMADLAGVPIGTGLSIDITPKTAEGKLLETVTLT